MAPPPSPHHPTAEEVAQIATQIKIAKVSLLSISLYPYVTRVLIWTNIQYFVGMSCGRLLSTEARTLTSSHGQSQHYSYWYDIGSASPGEKRGFLFPYRYTTTSKLLQMKFSTYGPRDALS